MVQQRVSRPDLLANQTREALRTKQAIITHASIPKEIREALGVTDGLLRLSVVIDDIDDLITDVDQALACP